MEAEWGEYGEEVYSKPGSLCEASHRCFSRRDQGALGMCRGGTPLCAFHVYCVSAFSLCPGFQGWAPLPFPSPYTFIPDNKVLYFWSFGFLFSWN